MKAKSRYQSFFRSYVRPHAGYIIVLLILGLISTLSSVITPLLIRSLIDNIIIAGNIRLFIPVLLLITLLFAVSGVALYLSTYLSGKLSAIVANSMRRGVFRRLQYKALSEIYGMKSGDILSRFMNDVSACQYIFTTYVVQLFSNLISLVLPLAIMVNLKWDLALISISVVAAYPPISFFFGKRLKVRQKSVLESTGRISSFLKESLSIFPLTKTFGLEEYQQKRLDKDLDKYYSSAISVSKTTASYAFIATFLIFLPILTLFVIGGDMAINGTITIGTLVAFLTYITYFYSPISALAELWTNIKMSTAAFDRIYEVLELEDEKNGESELKAIGKSIEFDHVNFSYGDNPVFDDLSIFFKRGINFLIGANGTGKTTILHLIVRFYYPDEGEIRIDGQDISKVKLTSLRKNISLLSQDVQLLDTTIYENIRLGKLEASEAEIVDAAKMARAHDFVSKLPKGYETQVGEGGLSLSGGEKQKIALARAILKGAPIILLDEVTSSIDRESKRSIYEALRELAPEKIVVIATHDHSEIKEDDRVVDLNEMIQSNSFFTTNR